MFRAKCDFKLSPKMLIGRPREMGFSAEDNLIRLVKGKEGKGNSCKGERWMLGWRVREGGREEGRLDK